jgi:hypothetical protein
VRLASNLYLPDIIEERATAGIWIIHSLSLREREQTGNGL